MNAVVYDIAPMSATVSAARRQPGACAVRAFRSTRLARTWYDEK